MLSSEDSASSEIQPPQSDAPLAEVEGGAYRRGDSQGLNATSPEPRDLFWVFVGGQGLRAGWSLLLIGMLYWLFSTLLRNVAVMLCPGLATADLSPILLSLEELVSLLALVGAAAFVAYIEQRKLLSYNLAGPRRAWNFVSGFAAGFLALTALVGWLAWGGWLRFGPVSLSEAEIFKYAGLWAVVFLLVGCFEEGAFRCYLQFTLARGINFWWALGILVPLCVRLALHSKGNGLWGVYAAALLGLFPCLILQVKNTPRSGFWCAAWVTSTLFGYWHTGNGGENWIGIFAAALIGFVFCVSVYVTGSAWWAVGCHAAWDWAETFFYGTADSGMVAPGHYLSATPLGNPFWSGGADGPEGSLLVLGVILLLLAALLLIHGRQKPGAAAPERAIG
jgi:membrane protease YdiL (CAAX protease family)